MIIKRKFGNCEQENKCKEGMGGRRGEIREDRKSL
jgi:hypothetical protein